MQHPHRPYRLLLAALAVVGVAATGAWLGRPHWLGDILALVVDYYVAAALLLLIAFSWRRAGGAAIILGRAGGQLASRPRVDPAPLPAAERTVRLLVYNIYHLNQDLGAVVEAVRQYDPDVVFLMEYSDAVQGQIEPAFADYPHRLSRTSRLTMGLALFSRLPIVAAECAGRRRRASPSSRRACARTRAVHIRGRSPLAAAAPVGRAPPKPDGGDHPRGRISRGAARRGRRLQSSPGLRAEIR